MRRHLALLGCLTALACADKAPTEPDDPSKTPEIHTPRWAFEPWISKDISDGPDTRAFVNGFIDRDIPVGVVVLDSPWETNYNTFIPNEDRYPAMPTMISDLRAQGVRTVLWVTQMMNEDSFDAEMGGDTYDGPSSQFLRGKRDEYFVNDGTTYFWWKGTGAGIDFFDDEARTWWHGLQDDLLDAGISGWKLDFGESYIDTDMIVTDKGTIPHQEYSEEYYRDFWAYGVNRVGREEFLTMVRPYDKSYQFEGRFFARPEHTPVGWVGDNRRDFVGLIDALDHLFRSADAGYVMIGSDIGGYLDRDDKDLLDTIPYNAEAFMRWTAMGALTPFMQLHGRANLEPWNVPERTSETLNGYRYWANLHHELVPFFYSLAEDAYDRGDTIMHPVGDGPDEWANDWRFEVGRALFVAPIIDETGIRNVTLPEGADWYDWWTPGADAIAGGTTLMDFDVGSSTRIPLFVRSGAIVPMTISSTTTAIGTEGFAGHLTVLVYPDDEPSTFVLRDEDDGKTEIGVAGDTVTISRALQPTIFLIRTEAITGAGALAEVADLNALTNATDGWWYDATKRIAYVKIAASSTSVDVTLSR